MRKLLSLVLALLLMSGVAFAASIPQSEDPVAGPAVWTVPVYNNSGAILDIGDVVVWDIGSSTGDDDNYVTTTTTADTALVAGVVYPSDIAIGGTGTIAVKGVVQVDSHENFVSQPGLACTSVTAGSARPCRTDANAFGINAVTGSNPNVCVHCN